MPKDLLRTIKRYFLLLSIICFWSSYIGLWAQEVAADSITNDSVQVSIYTYEEVKDSLQKVNKLISNEDKASKELRISREKGVKLARWAVDEAEKLRDTALWMQGLGVLSQYEKESEVRDSVNDLKFKLAALTGLQLKEIPKRENSYYSKNVSDYLSYYEDSTALLTFDEIRKRERDSLISFVTNKLYEDNPWSTLFKNSLDTDHVFWGKVIIRGHEEEDLEIMLSLDNAVISWAKVDIYAETTEGNFDHQIVGDKVLPEDKKISSFRNYFKVFIPKQSKRQLYFRMDASKPGTRANGLVLRMFNEQRVLKERAEKRFGRGIFFGIILIQAFYFLLMAFSTRETSYYYYVLYILGLLIYVSGSLFFNELFPLHTH
ncbi:MAG: 7TM-DISM domain-containing protein, partial [Bacteroidota bacterium]